MAENRKAQWDSMQIKILCEVCVEEVQAGNRSHNTLSKIGWKNALSKFNARANTTYILKQLRNKWDLLKTDWLTWKQLKSETGVGWNHNTGTVEAPNEWWTAKIKQHPYYKKFRHAGLENESEMEILFASIAVTGETAWTPGAGNLFPNNDFTVDGADHNEGSGSSDDGRGLPTPTNSGRSSGKRKQSASGSAGPSNKGKRKSTGGRAEQMGRHLERICDAVESYTSSQFTEQSRNSHKNYDSAEGGFRYCMDLLRALPGVEVGNKLYLLGARLFLKPEMRDAFLYHPTDECKLAWLNDELEMEAVWRRQQK